MGISQYIKEIGRGKDGARALTREQAADLFGQVLDGTVSDLEVGAFCLAMRIKGETPAEMAGFLDATHARMHRVPAASRPVVVLPSYNGARKLPVLTPLLALLLAREGLPVLVHGTATESSRVGASDVLAALGVPAQTRAGPIAPGTVAFVPTAVLCAGLRRPTTRRTSSRRASPAHSLVKLMNPVDGPALVIGSYTHPEYAVSMAATFELTGANALLLRGTEGEPVADPRRTPQMDAFRQGLRVPVQEAQTGSLARLPELPTAIDAASTAAYVRDILAGRLPVPAPIGKQLEHILRETGSS